MKKHLSTILLVLIFLVGLSLLLYPSFSDWWNTMHTSRVVASYTDAVSNMDDDKYAEVLNNALAYNQSLVNRSNRFNLSDAQLAEYNDLLNIGGTGVMGYIEIPAINETLPIYHGTDEAVLQVAVGHLEWTSLPVGGASSHCVLSGHRGLPSARLFTDIDQLVVGDNFILRILDEVLTYEVDQILIVEPTDTKDLQIIEGKDYCTLVTCTPYGINTHRLLVRGHRVDNSVEQMVVRVTADAVQIEPVIIAPIIGVPLLVLVVFLALLIPSKKHKKKK